jgi:hypothetical protein
VRIEEILIETLPPPWPKRKYRTLHLVGQMTIGQEGMSIEISKETMKALGQYFIWVTIQDEKDQEEIIDEYMKVHPKLVSLEEFLQLHHNSL